jgi:hypothetical protein
MPLMTPLETRPLVLLHIPRTGGMSLYTYLELQFEPSRVYPWGERIDGVARAHLDRYSFFGGHYSAADLDAHLPDSLTVTFLRRPEMRLRSLYAYWRAHTSELIESTGQHYMLAAHRLGFADFLRSEDETVMLNLRNGMTALLGRADYGDGYREVTEEDYLNACARLSRMWFVGLHEVYARSLRGLARRLSIPPVEEIAVVNAAAGLQEQPGFRAAEVPDITPSLVEQVKLLNSFDLMLYEFASQLFAVQSEGRAAAPVRLPVRRLSLFRDTQVQFGLGDAGNAMLAAGWSHPEEGFVWSDGEASELVLQTRAVLPAGTPLSLRLCPFVRARHPSLFVTITLDGEPLTRVLFALNDSCVSLDGAMPAVLFATGGHDLLTLTLALPELAEGEHVIGFEYSAPASPAEIGESPDDRSLGISLAALAVGNALAAE